jgi:hypothetical protein
MNGNNNTNSPTTRPATSSLSNTGKRNSKKRRRLHSININSNKPLPTESDVLLALQQERYDRLLYTANKHIHKQAKLVKNFLLQKEIKQQKQQQKHDHDKSTNENSKVQIVKRVDLDLVTKQALRQLGLYHSNPSLQVIVGAADKSEENNTDSFAKNGTSPTTNTTTTILPVPSHSLDDDDNDAVMVNAILTHKRFLLTMEQWNVKVTEYRQWCLQLEASSSSSSYLSKRPSLNQQQRPNSNKKRIIGGLHDTAKQPSAMFCTLNGGGGGGGGNNHDDVDEDNSIDSLDNDKAATLSNKSKRNRMGQRARKAKAMAIQAKQQGWRNDYQSLNWRAPKKSNSNTDEETGADDNNNSNKNKRTSDYHRSKGTKGILLSSTSSSSSAFAAQTESKFAATSTTTEHPSWVAAKQARRTGIVTFQGQKITFD